MMSPKILEIKKKQNHKVLFNTHLILCQNDMSHDMVINNHQSLFIGPMKIDQKCKTLPPLDHGGPKIKYTYFYCFS